MAFDHAFVSDLARAAETSRIVLGDCKIALVADSRLREFDFGAWEGLTWPQIVTRWPHLSDHGSTVAKRYQPEGGESFDDVTARVGAFLKELRRCDAERVLIVTHAGTLHALLAAFGSDLEDAIGDPMGLRFSPASISRITMKDGHAQLTTLNDVKHLHSPN